MKKFLLHIALLLPLFLSAQNSEYCDSVFIKCCEANQITSSTITILVANHSAYLFDYPGFVLIDDNADTIAKETVNYFGIGYAFQEHVLDIVHPFELPFDGELLLYTLFYDTLWCNFPVYIPDTVTRVADLSAPDEFKIFPNPAHETFYIQINNRMTVDGCSIEIINDQGKLLYRRKLNNSFLEMNNIKQKGLFFVRLIDPKGNLIQSKKIIIN